MTDEQLDSELDIVPLGATVTGEEVRELLRLFESMASEMAPADCWGPDIPNSGHDPRLVRQYMEHLYD